jgi:alpha-glucoside transport system permease protein
MVTWSGLLHTSWPKIWQIIEVLFIFFGIYTLAFAVGAKIQGKKQNKIALAVFLVPALILVMTGLGVPAIQTIMESFKNADSSHWVGFANYVKAFKDPEVRLAFFNTIAWILICPIVITTLGVTLAVMLNKMKHEALAKTLIFMPMAISFVGGSLIWNLMYAFQDPKVHQTGLVAQLLTWVDIKPPHLLLFSPWNNLLIMVVYIWGFTGFAMVILSAAIKAIPIEVEEAAALDGAEGYKMFRLVTVPMVKNTIIVVLTTAMVGTLKLFDVVHTMTGGNFKTDVLSNRMFDENFVYLNYGRGSALAVLIFLGVIPITYYNIRSLRRERKH